MRIVRALEAAQIHYVVTQTRSDGVSVHATLPGERWEIDILEDGDIDFERFVSNGTIAGESELKTAIVQFAEPSA